MRPVEKVSSYPRPPLIELVSGSVEIWIAGQQIALDQRYVRVCETFHPPTIYLHPSAFCPGTLHPSTGRPSFCEWKGVAAYWDVSAADGTDRRVRAGWSYPKSQSLSLSWTDGSVFIPAAWIAAGWKERTFWLSPESFMAAGSVHGSKDLSREIPIIPS